MQSLTRTFDRRPLFAAALGLAVLCTAALSAQTHYVPTAPGRWRPWAFYAYADNRRLLAAKPAEVKALETQLLALSAIIKKTPGFTEPIGVAIETAGDLMQTTFRQSIGSRQPAITTLPIPAIFHFGAFGVYEINRGGTVVRDDAGETSGLLFFVNEIELPLFYGGDNFVPEFENVDADVVLLAKSQPDLLGFPRYGGTLVLKKNPAPLWVAATLEDVLGLAGRGIEFRLTAERATVTRLQGLYDDVMDPAKRAKRIADYKIGAALSKDPGMLDQMMKAEQAIEARAPTEMLPPIADAKKRVAALERELDAARAAAAALSAPDRSAPACYAAQDPVSLSRFRRNPGGSCVALVRPNWKFFNPALPRSTPQILAITHFEPCFLPDRRDLQIGGCPSNKRLLESLDQQALLAWLQ